MRGERTRRSVWYRAGARPVGERWAPLLVRELVFGPKRFTDVRRGLPGASQNVLAQRLRELRRDGIVEQIRLGPPAATRAYRLTERGRGLEPILLELARWGSDLPITSGAELSTDALMFVPARPTGHGLARLDVPSTNSSSSRTGSKLSWTVRRSRSPAPPRSRRTL